MRVQQLPCNGEADHIGKAEPALSIATIEDATLTVRQYKRGYQHARIDCCNPLLGCSRL